MSPEPQLTAGERVGGRYRLLELVGSGAMGSVWAAHNEMTERKFALKVMNAQAALDPTAVQRFLQEARAAGSLRHPAIVEVYDVGFCEPSVPGGQRVPFLVMELLEGETLECRLSRDGTLTPQELLLFLDRIAQGLAVAHDAGIVHRDLKPANLFFHVAKAERIPKILDFGISKLLGLGASDGVLTVTGLVLGSPPYMSPEQAGGKPDVDARSDVWALGVIAYRALSGRLPFGAPNYNALMLEIIQASPEPVLKLCPELDPRLAAVVMSCLEKDRERRPRDARALVELLAPLLREDTESGLAQAGDASVRKPKRPWAAIAIAGTLLALGLLGLGLSRRTAAAPELSVAARATLPMQESAAAVPLVSAPAPVSPSSSEKRTTAASPTPLATASTTRLLQQKSGSRERALTSAARRVEKKPGIRAVTPERGPPPVNEGVTSPGL